MKFHTFQGMRASLARKASLYLDNNGGSVMLRELQTYLMERTSIELNEARAFTASMKSEGLILSARDGRSFRVTLTPAGKDFTSWLIENPAYGTDIRGVINIPQKPNDEYPLGVVIDTRLPKDRYRELTKDASLVPAFVPKGAEVYVRYRPGDELQEVPWV